MSGVICLFVESHFKAGDPAPSGYMEWHAWANAQHRAGLRQRKCWNCGLWRFPQETCCGPRPVDDGSFTVDDVLSGRKKISVERIKRLTSGV